MWQPFQNANQLEEGSRLRQVILDGNFQHESNYIVERIGNYYFMVRYVEQNGVKLPKENQTVSPYRIQGIEYFGFEIWTDQ